MLPETQADIILQRAEHLRLGIKKMIVQFRGQLLESVTVSMGLAIFPDHGGR